MTTITTEPFGPRDDPWEDVRGPQEPVTPRGTNDVGDEWRRAQDEINANAPIGERQTFRAKMIQKSLYLPAARGALNQGLPQTATTIAACSKPLSMAADRIAKKNSIVNRIVSMVEGTQSDTAILVGLHACIAASFALESGLIGRVIEKNEWLKNNTVAQGVIATALVSMMEMPMKILVRADVESENLDDAVEALREEAADLIHAQAVAQAEREARMTSDDA